MDQEMVQSDFHSFPVHNLIVKLSFLFLSRIRRHRLQFVRLSTIFFLVKGLGHVPLSDILISTQRNRYKNRLVKVTYPGLFYEVYSFPEVLKSSRVGVFSILLFSLSFLCIFLSLFLDSTGYKDTSELEFIMILSNKNKFYEIHEVTISLFCGLSFTVYDSRIIY